MLIHSHQRLNVFGESKNLKRNKYKPEIATSNLLSSDKIEARVRSESQLKRNKDIYRYFIWVYNVKFIFTICSKMPTVGKQTWWDVGETAVKIMVLCLFSKFPNVNTLVLSSTKGFVKNLNMILFFSINFVNAWGIQYGL